MGMGFFTACVLVFSDETVSYIKNSQIRQRKNSLKIQILWRTSDLLTPGCVFLLRVCVCRCVCMQVCLHAGVFACMCVCMCVFVCVCFTYNVT